MPRPNRVMAGHMSPWVEYAGELEAENKRLKSRGIEDMQHELAELREAMTEVLENVPMAVHYRHLLVSLLQEKGE